MWLRYYAIRGEMMMKWNKIDPYARPEQKNQIEARYWAMREAHVNRFEDGKVSLQVWTHDGSWCKHPEPSRQSKTMNGNNNGK